MDVNKQPSADDLRKFGNAMLIGFGALAILLGVLIPLWKAWRGTAEEGIAAPATANLLLGGMLMALGIALFLLSRGVPSATRIVYVVWMSVMAPVGHVMSTVVLTILFLVLLPPFALLLRFWDSAGHQA